MSSKKAIVSYVIMVSVFTLALMSSAEMPNQQVLSNMPQQSVTQTVADNAVSTGASAAVVAAAIFLVCAAVFVIEAKEKDIEAYCPWKNAHFATSKWEVAGLEEL